MIAERPKIHGVFFAAVIVAFLVVFLVLIVLDAKKKTDPEQEPPLHPSVVVAQSGRTAPERV